MMITTWLLHLSRVRSCPRSMVRQLRHVHHCRQSAVLLLSKCCVAGVSVTADLFCQTCNHIQVSRKCPETGLDKSLASCDKHQLHCIFCSIARATLPANPTGVFNFASGNFGRPIVSCK
jgi:hypothetical protein